jgi:hypothetical protein
MVKVPGYGYVTIIARVEETASSNGTWWDKRIQGELLKLGIRVSKGKVKKYMQRARARSTGLYGTGVQQRRYRQRTASVDWNGQELRECGLRQARGGG